MLPIRRTIANTIVGPVYRNICRNRFRGCTAARSPQDQRFHQAAATFPSRNLAGASQTSSRKQCCVARRFVQAESKTRVLSPGSTGRSICSGSRVGCESEGHAGGTPASTGDLPGDRHSHVAANSFIFGTWLISLRN